MSNTQDVSRADAPGLSVLLTFDFDALCIWLTMMGTTAPGTLSRGEFGARVGADRVLRLLRDFDIRSTWFVPGHTIDTFSDVCSRVVEAGHEIQHHGYAHEPLEGLDRATEARYLEQGMEAIERLTGRAPVGYRSPSWNLNPHSPQLLTDYGFQYDSSLMAHDLRMYWPRDGDGLEADGSYSFGEPTSIVEVPVSWNLDDFPPFTFVWEPLRPGYGSTEVIGGDWLDHIDYALEHEPNGVVNITMHPQVTGRVHVLRMVERVLQQIAGRPGLHFRTLTEAVDLARKHQLVETFA
ncbi:MAG: polysaccharide deacetylase [Acidimicrobiaceae bacterium]|nr:polysaccharide deacetylase [Acidimicrobiaceae bacterium]